jgi:hypothetical protein
MLRPRSVLLLAAAVASLIACSAPAVRRDPTTLVLDPYAVAHAGVAATVQVQVQAAPAQETRAVVPVHDNNRRMCILSGGKGSC